MNKIMKIDLKKTFEYGIFHGNPWGLGLDEDSFERGPYALPNTVEKLSESEPESEPLPDLGIDLPLHKRWETILVHRPQARKLKILFVTDFPKGSDGQYFAPQQQEMFERMVKAMKIEDGLWEVTSLFPSAPVRAEASLGEGFSFQFSTRQEDEQIHQNLEMLVLRILEKGPKVVVCFGAAAASALLNFKVKLSQHHGKAYHLEFAQALMNIEHRCLVVCTFHPDFLMINENMKATAWNDLKEALSFLR